MPSGFSPAYILHARAWRDTSLLLDVFSRDEGRISIAARGVKGRKRSASSGLLQPFIPLQMMWQQRGEWNWLKEVETRGESLILANDAILCGLYCNELLMRLLHVHDPQPEVFEHYSLCLAKLYNDQDLHSCLREFEWHLLLDLGYVVDVVLDAQGELIEAGCPYRFSEQGFWRAVYPSDLDYDGTDLLMIANQQWSGCRVTAKRLLRQLLAPHLGDKPIQTRALWQQKQVLKKYSCDE